MNRHTTVVSARKEQMVKYAQAADTVYHIKYKYYFLIVKCGSIQLRFLNELKNSKMLLSLAVCFFRSCEAVITFVSSGTESLSGCHALTPCSRGRTRGWSAAGV